MIVYCVRRTRLFCTFHNAFVFDILNTFAAQSLTIISNDSGTLVYLIFTPTIEFCLYIPMASLQI